MEEKVYTSVINWVKHEPSERKKFVARVSKVETRKHYFHSPWENEGPLSHACWEMLTLFFPKHQMITITESRAINPFYPGVQQSNHYCQLFFCFTVILPKNIIYTKFGPLDNFPDRKVEASSFSFSCGLQGHSSQLSGSFLAKVIEALWEHVGRFQT